VTGVDEWRDRNLWIFVDAVAEGPDKTDALATTDTDGQTEGPWNNHDDAVLVGVGQAVNAPKWVPMRLRNRVGLLLCDQLLGTADDPAQLFKTIGGIPLRIVKDWELDLIGCLGAPDINAQTK